MGLLRLKLALMVAKAALRATVVSDGGTELALRDARR